MHLNSSLILSQQQKLTLTPELKQSLDILQYNQLELVDFIKEELLNNPTLESSSSMADNDTSTSENPSSLDYYEENFSYRRAQRDPDLNPIDLATNTQTLYDHLSNQLSLLKLSPIDKQVHSFILGNLRPDGYLETDSRELADTFSISPAMADSYIRSFQSLDPIGIGARDLRECLLLQLTHLGMDESLTYRIVESHLDDIASNKLMNICLQLKEPLDRVKTAIEVIHHLEPIPGAPFTNCQETEYIIPDIILEKHENNYRIIYNDRTYIPRLSVSPYYANLLTKDNLNAETSDYLAAHIASAKRLIQNIEQRKKTIRDVTNAIVNCQREFLDHGVSKLRILNMDEVAEELGIHKSTVSRAISGKYIQCHRGTYPLKYFFQNGVRNTRGNGASSESIKAIIRDMIAAENPKKPLSDQAIADDLNANKIIISRRTVAKYRDALNIPSKSRRKAF